MSITLSAKSLSLLSKAHPDLQRVVKRAAKLSKLDFTITCVARTVAEQRKMVAKGASQTMNSRHLIAKNGYSHACDLAPIIGGKVRWDWPLFHILAKTMFEAAQLEEVTIRWGGNWKQSYTEKLAKFADGPHFELPEALYPGTK